MRRASIQRVTKETNIRAAIAIEGRGILRKRGPRTKRRETRG